MSIDEVIDLQISANTVVPSRAGFGVPLLMACHSVTPNVVDTFEALGEVSDAGFPLTHPVYLMAQRAFSQNPSPTSIVVGKRALKYTKIVNLLPQNTTQGFHYQFDAIGVNGTKISIDYAVTASETIAQICTAITALLSALNGVTVTATATAVVFTASATGTLFDIQNLPRITDCQVKDVTADPGIATDYAAIKAVDNSSWYGIAIDSNSKAEILALAAAVEADRRLFCSDTCDTETQNNGITNDVISTIKSSAYARTDCLFYSRSILSYAALGWMSLMLPKDPGSNTWAFKTIAGLLVDNIQGGSQTNLAAKNGNYYVNIGGINTTYWGTVGSGTFIDITVGLDWLHARIQESIFAALASSDKIPYTDSGADVIRSILSARLDAGIKVGLLAATPAPTITIPKVADQDPIDRGNRFMPGISFTAQLAGAIHKLKITGTISV